MRTLFYLMMFAMLIGCNDQVMNPELVATEIEEAGEVHGKTNNDLSPPDVFRVLREFAADNGGTSWTNNQGWTAGGSFGSTLASLEDLFHGLTYNSESEKFSIDLTNNGLSGTLNTSKLESINSVLGSLNLSDNKLTSIPASIGDLTGLTVLDLSVNLITGNIPTQVYDLTNLTHLDLSDNELTGGIHSDIGDLTNLIRLDLDGNRLSGSLPSTLSNLTNLETLFLEENQLSGTFPGDFTGMSSLQWVWLDYNDITGTIPNDYCTQFPSLTRLWLNGNKLMGTVPMCESPGKNQSIALESIYFENTGLCTKRRVRRWMKANGIEWKGPRCGRKGLDRR
ncbi:MAG: hypothetical protein F4019_10230 [Rhodothermaceae bacterium]|nr:hypothetical protein [Rhodothermaceae bacterium]